MKEKFETITIQISDNIATILLCRPERLNAFDLKLGQELVQALTECKKQRSLRAIVIKGTGKGFCGGGDVKEMHNAENKSQFLRDLTKVIGSCVSHIRTIETPVIAAVNGAAFGAGLSLALACDIIIAADTATFGTAFTGIGLAPGCGTFFFSQVAGYQKACEYILTSKTFDARQAQNLGFVSTIVPQHQLDATVEKLTKKFQSLPPIAVGKAKMLVNKSLENNLSTHLELESITAANSAKTKDFAEGVAAFVEKRKPTFQGK